MVINIWQCGRYPGVAGMYLQPWVKQRGRKWLCRTARCCWLPRHKWGQSLCLHTAFSPPLSLAMVEVTGPVLGSPLCMGPFTWPYNEMLVERSTDLADDSCSIWPLMMSEDLIVSNWKGLLWTPEFQYLWLEYWLTKRTIQRAQLAFCPCVWVLCYLHNFVFYSIPAQHCPLIAYVKQNDVHDCEFLYHSFFKGLPF